MSVRNVDLAHPRKTVRGKFRPVRETSIGFWAYQTFVPPESHDQFPLFFCSLAGKIAGVTEGECFCAGRYHTVPKFRSGVSSPSCFTIPSSADWRISQH